MEQIPVKRIEEVIVVAGDDKQKQKEFYELLLSTEFYVAGSLEAEEGATEGYFVCVISKERVDGSFRSLHKWNL